MANWVKHDKANTRFKSALALGDQLHRDLIMALAICIYLIFYPDDFDPNISFNYIEKAKKLPQNLKIIVHF